MTAWNKMYAIMSTIPPTCETPPLVRKRQNTIVVIKRKGSISVKIVMATAKGEVRRTIPRIRVRFVRFEPMMPPIAK
jgi:hypothetical protein